MEALRDAASFLKRTQLTNMLAREQKWGLGECLVRTALKPQTRTGQAPGARGTGQAAVRGGGLHQPHALVLSLVQLEDYSRRMDEYLRQSLPYLQSPQQPLRLEAVRFIGEPEPQGPSVPKGRRARGRAGGAAGGGSCDAGGGAVLLGGSCAAGKGWPAGFETGCVCLGLIGRQVADWHEDELPVIYDGE